MTASVAPLRIAVISDELYPAGKANCEQVANTVAALTAAGLSADLVAPRPWRHLLTARQDRRRSITSFYDLAHDFRLVELPRPPLWPARLDSLSHGLLAPVYARAAGYDVIYTRNSLSALMGVVLGQPVVYETYRLYDGLRSPTARYLVRRGSRHLLGIITHSTISRDSMVAAGADPSCLAVIPNGFNPKPFAAQYTRADARVRVGWDSSDRVVCYAGRLDVEKGMETILELAVRTPGVQYVMIGYSQREADDWVVDAARARGAVNVRWLPWRPIGELIPYLVAADALLIPPTAAPMNEHGRTVLPLKTFVYMAAGRPIVAPALPDIRQVLNHHNAVLIPPDDLDAACDAIERVFNDTSWAAALAARAQLDAQAFTWARRAELVHAFVQRRLVEWSARRATGEDGRG